MCNKRSKLAVYVFSRTLRETVVCILPWIVNVLCVFLFYMLLYDESTGGGRNGAFLLLPVGHFAHPTVDNKSKRHLEALFAICSGDEW